MRKLNCKAYTAFSYQINGITVNVVNWLMGSNLSQLRSPKVLFYTFTCCSVGSCNRTSLTQSDPIKHPRTVIVFTICIFTDIFVTWLLIAICMWTFNRLDYKFLFKMHFWVVCFLCFFHNYLFMLMWINWEELLTSL